MPLTPPSSRDRAASGSLTVWTYTVMPSLLMMEEYPDICVITDTKFTDAEVVTLQFRSMLRDAEELGLSYLFDRGFSYSAGCSDSAGGAGAGADTGTEASASS